MTGLTNDMCEKLYPEEFESKTQEDSLRGALEFIHTYTASVAFLLL